MADQRSECLHVAEVGGPRIWLDRAKVVTTENTRPIDTGVDASDFVL